MVFSLANIARIGTTAGHRACLDRITSHPARLMGLVDYGIREGNPATLVVLDCYTEEDVIRQLALPLFGFKDGKRTFTRSPGDLHKPG